MLRKLRYLEWDEFDVAVHDIVNKVQDLHITSIYGEPRGGLILAVALSHRLDKPLIDKPQIGTLWVDDIVETGRTMNKVKEPAVFYASWFGLDNFKSLHYSEKFSKNEWLVFPWEDQSKARKDMEKYELSRQ